MPGKSAPKKPAQKLAKPSPIDDMRDGENIRELENPLGLVISYIHTSLFETYNEYDREAITQQKYHRWFSYSAVFFGSVAIILAIFQVFLQALPAQGAFVPDSFSLIIFEKGSFLAAVIAIAVALGSRFHKDWLKKRFMAEQCRSLKFRALIHPYLSFSSDDAWTDRFSRWKKRFDEKVSDLTKTEKLALGEILIIDKIHDPPHDTSGSPLNVPYLVMLAEYYQKKRISTQIDYFSSRARSFRDANKMTGRIPDFCFIGGVVFSAVYFGLRISTPVLLGAIPNKEMWAFFQSLALLITLALPTLGFAAKTLRSSVEVSRSATLFSAKCRALKQFDERLAEERAREHVDWQEILKIMWECENFFESENREWLRMMNDAVWY